MKVVDSYAALARSRTPEHLSGVALRTKSSAARQIFARLASGGECDYERIVTAVAADGVPPQATLADADRCRWLAALARVMAAQNLHHDDPVNALAIMDAVVDTAGSDVLDADQQAYYAQLLYRHGRYDRADVQLPKLTHMPPVFAEYLQMDLANPYVRPGRDEAEWLKLLNEPFTRAGVEPVGLLPEGATPFDRLTAQPRTVVADGPLVSVVMSAYRPDEHLFSAVRSILDQTWRNLELIIVDDASGPEYDHAFAAAADDPRVRVIRRETNGGTYLVRNVGIHAARGEFVTFQDSDDWSHPRRIELQVTAMLEAPERIGTRSLAIRAQDNLDHQWLGYPAQRMNASSLMFRVAQAREKIGHFDSVRKSADFEFAGRFEAAFHRKITDIRVPLAYTRLRMASLSRSDFTMGWSAPGRIVYQAAYRHWHRQIAEGADPFLARELSTRPFPAPRAYLRGITPAPEARRHFDVVLMDDWAASFDSVDRGIEQIDILTRSGLSVGILHTESTARMAAKRQHVAQLVQEKVNTGVVDRITLDEDISVSLVMVLDPAVIQFAAATPAALRAQRVVVTAPRRPAEYPGLELAYDERTCIDNARAIFGVQPRWAPEPAATPVDFDRWTSPRTRRRSTRPVIGQCAADGEFSWPDSEQDLHLAYPDFGDVDVRVLADGAAGARVRRHRAKSAYLVYRPDQIGLRAFVNQLDFFVYLPSSKVTVPPVYVIAAAMANGAVVILPKRFEPLFGPAAVYCTEAEVVSTVRTYYGDGERYAQQVEAGGRYAREQHSAAEYTAHVKGLLG